MSDGGSLHAAMILCAGLGTRLRPLTDLRAKPMVPVGDAPAVAHVARRVRLALAEGGRLVVNVHHRPEDVAAWAEAEHILVSHEAELLGTAGGVARAAAMLGAGDVLIWNGDILSELDPRALLATHAVLVAGAALAGATLAVRPRPAHEGNVGLAEDGTIVRLRQESFGRETRGGDFLGIHVLGERLRALLPATGCLVGDVYLPALRRGETLRAHETSAGFVDIGSVAQYLAANAAWLAARGLDSWAHPTARVNASITGSVVGEGARVDAAALDSVVWPGAHVQSACTGAVVT
jgi:mannose-1-phosphate guanylyltransferase